MKKKKLREIIALMGILCMSSSLLTSCSNESTNETDGNGDSGCGDPKQNFDGKAGITKVLDYRPAPGQFVNKMPSYEAGNTQAQMNQKVLEAIGDSKKSMITLGAYGGYVVVGFDHTIRNAEGKKDFRVLGNAFAGSSEPAIVWVAFDENKNGTPDADEWYELSGSEHKNAATIKKYEITYARNEAGHVPTPDPDNFLADDTYCPWTDNQGRTGYVYKNTYNHQEYYPQWIADNQMKFAGTLLPNNGVDHGEDAFIRWELYPYDWGYADNAQGGDSFDIDWAVDAKGAAVKLPGADFIKIHTGVNQYCGWTGEVSSEVSGVEDLHMKAK